MVKKEVAWEFSPGLNYDPDFAMKELFYLKQMSELSEFVTSCTEARRQIKLTKHLLRLYHIENIVLGIIGLKPKCSERYERRAIINFVR